jgi:hypothetical protein
MRLNLWSFRIFATMIIKKTINLQKNVILFLYLQKICEFLNKKKNDYSRI